MNTDYRYKIGDLGLTTIETIVSLRDRVGTQTVSDTFTIKVNDAEVETYPAVRLPVATYRKSRGRNGSYIRHMLHVYHMKDGTFLFHHPHCKLESTSSVTTIGQGLAGLNIPANVTKVTVLDLHHDLRAGAKGNAILFNMAHFSNDINLD
jgi:hypothetical protein